MIPAGRRDGARRPRLFAPGILYYVIVRGNYRQKTFLGGRDYQAYLERLKRFGKPGRLRVHQLPFPNKSSNHF